jgi:8-oxo-dGTP pyrophosphatase MutT (NUDIX family)
MSFHDSYFGKIRKLIGPRMLKVPGARAVIVDAEKRVLLQLRGDSRCWGLPSGLPEEEEGIVDCLLREVKEETGLSLIDYTPFGFACSPKHEIHQYPHGDIIQCYSLVFFSSNWHGELRGEDDETLDLRFFPTDQLPDVIPNHLITIEKYAEYRKTGVFQIF